MAHLETEVLEDRLLLSATLPLDNPVQAAAEAREVVLSPDGFARTAATLQGQGDAALFQFTAPFSGPMQIEDHAGPDATFVTQVEMFDADGTPVPPQQFYRAGGHSVLGFDVRQGQKYFVKAGAAPVSDPPIASPLVGSASSGWGGFELYFGPGDDAGNRADTATPVPAAVGKMTGRIEVPSDVDRWLYVAPVTGRLQVQWNLAQPGSGAMRVLDATENVLPPTTIRSGGILEFAVTAGQTYFLEMIGPAEWSAEVQAPLYDLTLNLVAAPPVATQPPGQGTTGPDTPQPGGSASGSDSLVAAGVGFFDQVDLSRYLGGDHPEGTATGLLALPESGHALVGALLSGAGMPGIASAYFGSGGTPPLESPAAEAAAEPSAAVRTVNYKIGVQDALQGRLTEARRRWLNAGQESAEPERLETDDPMAMLSVLLNEELPRLGQPLSDAALSLLQQVMHMGRSLLPAPPPQPTNAEPSNPVPESNAAPPALPDLGMNNTTDSNGLKLGHGLLALLLSLSAAQLWRPARRWGSRHWPLPGPRREGKEL